MLQAMRSTTWGQQRMQMLQQAYSNPNLVPIQDAETRPGQPGKCRRRRLTRQSPRGPAKVLSLSQLKGAAKSRQNLRDPS